MAPSRSRCSCLSLSNVARSSRISSLSMDAPAPCCALRGQAKYHGESEAAQGFWHGVALPGAWARSGPGRRPDTGVDIRQIVSDLSQSTVLDQLSRRSEYG